MLKNYLQHIDLFRIAGIRKILGVDLRETSVRVVELERSGPFYNKLKSRFRILKAVSKDLDEATPGSEKARILKELLHQNGIHTRHAVSAIDSRAVKIVRSTVPPTVHNIPEWIEENQDRLLRLPISPSEVTIAYQLLDSSDSGQQVEISFVRKSAINEQRAFFQQTGLQLLAFGVGEGDARLAEEFTIDPPEAVGDYKLGIGLAIKGFLSELSPLNLLGVKEKEDFEVSIYQTLVKRAVIACGAILIALLSLQMATDWIIESQKQSLEEAPLEGGSSFAGIAVLEKQVREMESQVAGSMESASRIRFAKVIYEMAHAAPSELWLSKLSVVKSESGAVATISGYAKSPDKVTDFLKNLTRFCQEVQLTRSGATLPSENVIPLRARKSDFVTFAIKVQVK